MNADMKDVDMHQTSKREQKIQNPNPTSGQLL